MGHGPDQNWTPRPELHPIFKIQTGTHGFICWHSDILPFVQSPFPVILDKRIGVLYLLLILFLLPDPFIELSIIRLRTWFYVKIVNLEAIFLHSF